ncbi:Prolipoprotein diacylglyceryl transferase [Burkholderia sp. KJ006]|nr:Prolipoprotein diacylglyceryl transferase [Burkholderia sp. KJ006]
MHGVAARCERWRVGAVQRAVRALCEPYRIRKLHRELMIIHPNFDPVAIHLGPLAVRWYGLMYLVGFIAAIVVGRVRLKLPHVAAQGWTAKDIDDMMFYGVLGTVLGGRLGYVLFYKADFYLSHPLDIFKVWEGGMSFHGGFLGVTLAMILFAWQRKRHWLQVTDFVAPMVPTGLAAGRLGNFINGELWGRVTDPSAPWAMLFPGAMRDDAAWLPKHPALVEKWHLADVFMQYQMLPRHPSQLYEIALEGVVLFFVLFFFSRKPRPMGAVSALFLIGYGLARFTVEFAREPDDFLGLLALGLSMGQWLSLPMIVAGIAMLVWAYRRRGANAAA